MADPAPQPLKELRAQPVAERQRRDIRGKHGIALLGYRGWALADFLRKMKAHNAKVVGALTGKKPDGKHA